MEREDAPGVFTKVNRGGFREIRTGVGRTVKTRTDARGVELFHSGDNKGQSFRGTRIS
jgi:hypothetical protein